MNDEIYSKHHLKILYYTVRCANDNIKYSAMLNKTRYFLYQVISIEMTYIESEYTMVKWYYKKLFLWFSIISQKNFVIV